MGRKGSDGYRKARHNKTLLMAHLIFVTKYRKKLSAKGIWETIKRLIFEKCCGLDIHVAEIECDIDHIHLLIEYDPTLSISRIVALLKQYSTYHIWRSYAGYLRKLYWKERTLWSDGYFACSIGNASKETIEKYIRNQG